MTYQELLTTYRRLIITRQEFRASTLTATESERRLLQVLHAQNQASLSALAHPMRTLLAEIDDWRILHIIQQYYVKGMTDSAIAAQMHLTGSRVNQLRQQYLRRFSGKEVEKDCQTPQKVV